MDLTLHPASFLMKDSILDSLGANSEMLNHTNEQPSTAVSNEKLTLWKRSGIFILYFILDNKPIKRLQILSKILLQFANIFGGVSTLILKWFALDKFWYIHHSVLPIKTADVSNDEIYTESVK